MARFLEFEGVDAVLFDCDGVLVDSEPVSEWAWRSTLEEVGLELGDFSDWVGKTDQALGVAFSAAAGVSASRLVDRAAEYLASRLADEPIALFEDAQQALDRALASDLEVAVVSNSEAWRLDALLTSAKIADRFRVKVSSDDVARPKPEPDVYLRAAELVGKAPSRCLVVEDSPTGVASARAAGMRVVAVSRGVFDPSDLAHATRVVESLSN
ncbi:MAG TPA: HAD family phosphatase [Acidimicrobiia bacterium]|nr:HAD family phosphatase [Acidimicrobiia bacterium]